MWLVATMLLAGCGGVASSPAGSTAKTGAPTVSATPTASESVGASSSAALSCLNRELAPVGLLKNQSIEAMGRMRTYEASVPDAANAGAPIPVVFVWHGDGGTGDAIRNRLALEAAAADQPAIFVYPDGLETPTGWWEMEQHAAKNKDVALFDALLERLEASYCVDAARVFSTGFSSGGFFTNHLACERGDRLRAIAPQSGGGPYWPDSAYNDDGQLKCPTHAVPALIIHGNDDPTVPNDASPANLSGGWQSFEHWAYWNHPAPRSGYAFETDPVQAAPCVQARDLPDDHPVIRCFIDGLGHETWSEEAPTVWAFFSAFR